MTFISDPEQGSQLLKLRKQLGWGMFWEWFSVKWKQNIENGKNQNGGRINVGYVADNMLYYTVDWNSS